MWLDYFVTAFGAGSLTGVITWLFSGRKRNNDFISDLQKSINILSDNYTKTLNELVTVKMQNATLLSGQNAMSIEIDNLKKENSMLIEKINKLNQMLEKYQKK